ncbi:protein RESTRICTED TEV MOVEMENT 3-like [Prosopis cineraria]|uniref:protein RESTRICTED TEV MOVEMENT 3-like n=1 Tax=Prosopis cineraria TaxID=364024 RepID=UPI00241092A6|nr:protein RESTRICTED TEV MOVEMENT 3-like [Prosopis cineraria]XP_054815806.1 protein RESTRICTED TEV MOVEMENT 3-like [Prosopis cineraria]
MKSQEPKDITHKKIAWTISNFSSLKTNTRHLSDVFMAGGCAWRLCIYKGRLGMKSLAIFLKAVKDSSLPQGWSINVACTFTVVNQLYSESSLKEDLELKFCENSKSWGYQSFMELTMLQNPYNGYILNDKCIIEVEFSKVSPIGMWALVPKDDDVAEFKDLGLIEKALVPLLEEACSWHPSLMDCKQKRSRKFTEWAFIALGRVLQFLKNKKWKDMNEKACEELQHLWEELEMSRLDLRWLEPLVKSALNMKGYAEKVETMKKLKQNLVVLEIEMNKAKEKLANAEESVEMIRKELVNAENDFEEKDLDTEIGYGKS